MAHARHRSGLIERGDRVRIAGYDSQQESVARMGFDVAVLRRGGSKPVGPDPLRAVFEGVFCNGYHVADVAEQAADFEPDLLVIDCLLFGALAGAEVARLPAVALVHSAPRALAEGPGMTHVAERVNALRAEAGLSPVDDVLSAWTRGAALATSIPELDGEVQSPGFEFVGRSPIRATEPGTRHGPSPTSDR